MQLFDFRISKAKPEQLQLVKSLQKRCYRSDGFALPLYERLWHQRLEFAYPNDVLVWHNNRLIGYLGIFFFKLELPEIVLMVDPLYRGKKIAKRLLEYLKKKLSEVGIQKFLLVTAPSSISDKFFISQAAQHHHSELVMQASSLSRQDPNSRLKIQHAGSTDIEQIVSIHQACFDTEQSINRKRFLNNLEQTNYAAYLFSYDQQMIGKLHMRREDLHIKLYDICVLPEFRQRGFGVELIQLWYESIGKKIALPITLEIMEDNQAALRLYQKCGFEIISQLAYWQFKV